MAKTAKRHRCIDCGSTTARWAGRCPTCGEWNPLVEEAQLGSLVQAVDALGLSTMPVPLSSVDVSEAAAAPTGVEEFDRVLAGGLVPARRWGEQADVASIVAGLASGAFAFATGSVIAADGGLSLERL